MNRNVWNFYQQNHNDLAVSVMRTHARDKTTEWTN